MKRFQFAGASATVGNAENVRKPTMADMAKSTATIYPDLASWEGQFRAFALAHGCDLDANGILLLPDTYDIRDVPPRYRGVQVRFVPGLSDTAAALRNPSAVLPTPTTD